jgi:hypothetical protein
MQCAEFLHCHPNVRNKERSGGALGTVKSSRQKSSLPILGRFLISIPQSGLSRPEFSEPASWKQQPPTKRRLVEVFDHPGVGI